MGMPPWFPLGAEVVTDYQIPVLPLVPVDDLPTEMLAYDKIGKAIERRLVLGNFGSIDMDVGRVGCAMSGVA
jgi:hypothetical protein